MIWRWTDRVALGCFSSVWVAMLLFHVLPVVSSRWGGSWEHYRGWVIWEQWWEGVKGFDELDFDWPDAPIWAALHLAALMYLVSPFVIRLLASNRIVWWLFVVMSSMALVGITGILQAEIWNDFEPGYETIRSGFWLLMASPVIHFTGVLFVRKRREGSGAFQAP